MNNSKSLKNELIFSYASGTASFSKSLMAATYLHLNSAENKTYKMFESFCGNALLKNEQIKPKNLTAKMCINNDLASESSNSGSSKSNPISKIVGPIENIKWKKIFKGFEEFSFSLATKEKVKLLRIGPGVKVPMHSHSGNEYILVLDGSFHDEYGTYIKGDLQINDSKIRHTPIGSNNGFCICMSIVEDDLIFFGPFSPILNIFTTLKSFFISFFR